MRKLSALLLIILVAMTSIALAQEDPNFTGLGGLVSLNVPEGWEAYDYDTDMYLEYYDDSGETSFNYEINISLVSPELLTSVGADPDLAGEDFLVWYQDFVVEIEGEDIAFEWGDITTIEAGANTLSYVEFTRTETYDDEPDVSWQIFGWLDAVAGNLVVQGEYYTYPDDDDSQYVVFKDQFMQIMSSVTFEGEFSGMASYVNEAGDIGLEYPLGWDVYEYDGEIEIDTFIEMEGIEYEFDVTLTPAADFLGQVGLDADISGEEFIDWLVAFVTNNPDEDQSVEFGERVNLELGDTTLSAIDATVVETYDDESETTLSMVGLLEVGNRRYLVEMEYQTYPEHNDSRYAEWRQQALDILSTMHVIEVDIDVSMAPAISADNLNQVGVLARVPGTSGSGSTVGISPDGAYLALVADAEGSIESGVTGEFMVLDGNTGAAIATIETTIAEINGLVFSEDGSQLFVVGGYVGADGFTGAIEVFDTMSWEATALHDGLASDFIYGFALTPDGATAFVPYGSYNSPDAGVNMVTLADGSVTQLALEPKGEDEYLNIGAIALSDEFVAVGTSSAARHLVIFDRASGEKLHVIGSDLSSVYDLAFSADGSRLAVVGWPLDDSDTDLVIYDTADFSVAHAVDAYSGAASNVWFLDAGAFLTVNDYGWMRAFDPTSGEQIAEINIYGAAEEEDYAYESYPDVAIYPNGNAIAVKGGYQLLTLLGIVE